MNNPAGGNTIRYKRVLLLISVIAVLLIYVLGPGMSAKLSPEALIPISFESDAGLEHVQLNDVQRVPGHPEYLQWNVTNNGTDTDVWAAPVAFLYSQTLTPPYYANVGVAVGFYEANMTGCK